LASNATKFSRKGEDIFFVLNEKVRNGKYFIFIEVIDNGIGLSQQDQEKLFQPFFQTTNIKSKRMNPNGNGLGLSICKDIALSMKGDIDC
jgi:two-component system sensor histidine kinase EvgS